MLIGNAETRTEARPDAFRWMAFGVHLAISLIVLGALLYVLFYHWFPGYLFDTDGGWQALRVIAGVDIILGPLLTLIAANPKKSSQELRKDFTVIGVIQVCALSAGTWLAWDNRPYAMLWYDGMVYSLPWSALRDEPALATIEKLGGDAMPRRVVVDLPFDITERAQALEQARNEKVVPFLDARRYIAWPPSQKLTEAFTLLALEMSGNNRDHLEKFLGEQSSRAAHGSAVLVAVRSRYDAYFLAMDPTTGGILDAVRVTPAEKLLNGLYSPHRLQALLSTGTPATEK